MRNSRRCRKLIMPLLGGVLLGGIAATPALSAEKGDALHDKEVRDEAVRMSESDYTTRNGIRYSAAPVLWDDCDAYRGEPERMTDCLNRQQTDRIMGYVITPAR